MCVGGGGFLFLKIDETVDYFSGSGRKYLGNHELLAFWVLPLLEGFLWAMGLTPTWLPEGQEQAASGLPWCGV